MEWLLKGGILMIPLILCSVVAMAIIMERLIYYKRTLKTPLFEYQQPELVVRWLRRRMAGLRTVITIAPMLGLLGTVTGLMKSFYLLGNQVDNYNPKQISLGISEALITTAFGLIIAVTATVFYNYLTSRLEDYIADYNTRLSQDADGPQELR
ncbi:MAG: MotA/TolQ/ExbB proton channel family protein [Bacillota bacterium]|jgi:biopolymer transport protein ExbB/TolQ